MTASTGHERLQTLWWHGFCGILKGISATLKLNLDSPASMLSRNQVFLGNNKTYSCERGRLFFFGVKTREVSLCFVAILRVRVYYYLDSFVFFCFTSLASVTGSYTEDEPNLCLGSMDWNPNFAISWVYKFWFRSDCSFFRLANISLKP